MQTSAGLTQHSTFHNCLKMNVSKENHDAQSRSLDEVQRHPIYWFDDGTLILEVQDVQFRVHHSLFQYHSSFLASAKSRILSCTTNSVASYASEVMSCGADQGFRPKDVEVLLEHIYHDM